MATLTTWQLLITVIAVAGGTALTRFISFLIFPPGKEAPAFIKRLQSLLPCAIIGMLVVYCMRNVDVFSGSRGMPEAIAAIGIILLHFWRKNSMLSILGGTALYMVLVQFVF